MAIKNTISQEETLLNEFGKQMETAQSDLQKIWAAISEGRVPGWEATKAFHGSLNALRDKYNEISTLAKEKLPEAELPPEGSTAQEYVTALTGHKQVVLEELREKALEVLNRFTNVKSDESVYWDLIRKSQQDAIENIKLLQKPERVREQFTEIEDYEKVLAPAEAFLNALDCENMDTRESVRKLDKMCEYFSLGAAGGIMHGKYYVR